MYITLQEKTHNLVGQQLVIIKDQLSFQGYNAVDKKVYYQIVDQVSRQVYDQIDKQLWDQVIIGFFLNKQMMEWNEI